jgi:hypothetical protein
MLSRRRLLGTVVLTLALARQGAGSAADSSPTKSDVPPFQLQVSPGCVRPGGLLRAVLMGSAEYKTKGPIISSPEYRALILGSPEYLRAYFDAHGLTQLGFFDVFTEADIQKHSFFDIFFEELGKPGARQKLSLVCGFLTPVSIELLMQMPPATDRTVQGGGILIPQVDGKLLAGAPVMAAEPDAAIQHALGSGEGVTSFFDILIESWSWGNSLAATRGRNDRRVLLQQGRLILDTAGEAEASALHKAPGLDSPELERVGLDLFGRLRDDLERLMMVKLNGAPN